MATLYGRGTITEIEKGRKYRLELSTGRNPETGEYERERETFRGTRRQAELRIEQLRAKAELRRDLRALGVKDADLERHGLDLEAALLERWNARQVRDRLDELEAASLPVVTLGDWCETYIKMRADSGKYRRKTLQQERSTSKHLVRGLGGTPLGDITPLMVAEHLAAMRADGVGDTTCRQCYKMLKQIMRYAVRNGLIDSNPVDNVDAPRKPKPKRDALSSAEARRLGKVATSGTPTAAKTAVYLALHCGTRLGETLGLEWRHVYTDGKRPFIHVIQQHTAGNERTPLKTDSDDNPIGRVLPLDASTVAALDAWRVEQRKQLAALGIEQGSSTPVFTSGAGSWMNHGNFQRWWRGFCTDNGFGRWVDDEGREIVALTIGADAAPFEGCRIEWRDSDGWPCDENGKRYSRTYKRPAIKRRYEGLNFHELRHTHFTLMVQAGVDIPTAQALGGWDSPEMLNTVYLHATPEHIWSTRGFMDDMEPDEAPDEMRFAHDLPKTEQTGQPIF